MLAAVAILAMSAVVASAAQAVEFRKPAESITITTTPDGTGTNAHHVVDVAGASLTCPGASAQYTIPGTSTSTLIFSFLLNFGNFFSSTAPASS